MVTLLFRVRLTGVLGIPSLFLDSSSVTESFNSTS